MPVASRRTCEFPGCVSGPIPEGSETPGPYISHVDFTTRAEVQEDIRDHVNMVHNLPLEHQKLSVKQYKVQTERMKVTNSEADGDDSNPDSIASSTASRKSHSKLESIPRPRIKENCTQSDWSFFSAQWERYVSGSDMTPQQQINHLWASCSEDLQRSLHNGNSAKIQDPAILLGNIQLIAVKKLNNLVNVVEFQSLTQFPEETVTAFGTRLNGKANLCDLITQCENCQTQVSFKNKFLMYQFIRGLRDQHAQERILEASAQEQDGEMSLERVIKLAESYEMGKISSQMVKSGQVSKISDYKKAKNNKRQDNRSEKDTSNKCGNCGRTGHSSKLNDRRQHCPAFDKNCSKCNTNGHFADQCHGGPRQSRDKSKTRQEKPNASTSKVN